MQWRWRRDVRNSIWMSLNNQITLHVVDDEELVQNSLEAVLRFGNYDVSTFSSGNEFLEALPDGNPDCVILDVRMPQMSGMEVLKVLNQSHPDLPVIVMSGFADVAMAVKAMQAGAAHFIEKPFKHEDVLITVENVMQRSSSSMSDTGAAEVPDARLSKLSDREMDVLTRLVQGKQNKVVARELEISPRTVEVHRARIMQRLDVTSFAELVRLAVMSGLDID
jgi:two-component system response regulator FixJ